mgnify:CR=1 FL=1
MVPFSILKSFMTPFNIPCSVGSEAAAVQSAIEGGHISGNGPFTAKVKAILAEKLGFEYVFPTHSGTGALEMAAMLCEFQPGDEVILPSFTHVGTANAFERAGAKLVFADSLAAHPNISPEAVLACITPKTKALVVVHYAGMACDMDAFQKICEVHNLRLIEDAAHAIGAAYNSKNLGKFGSMAAFSFHETKNITCGQGGMLVVNDDKLLDRAAILWENGTNRAAFFKGEVNQYTWVDTGSCFTLSDLNAAYLYAQLEVLESIQARRLAIWNRYAEKLKPLLENTSIKMPIIPDLASINGHIFYLILPNRSKRDALIQHLGNAGTLAVFHYIPLHSSPHFAAKHSGIALFNAEKFSDCLLRLPMYDSLSESTQDEIILAVREWIQES